MKPYRKVSGLNPDNSKRYSPYWWISWEDAEGRRIHESTKTESLTEAKRILADRQAAVRAQGLVFDKLKRTFTFCELAGDYLAWQRVQGPQRESQMKYRLDRLVEAFGSKDTNKVGSEDLNAYRAMRVEQYVGKGRTGRLVSHSTVNRELEVLSAAYNWAKGEDKYQDMLRRNPFVRRKHRVKEPASPSAWFEPDSKRRFLEACDRLPTDRKHFPPALLKDIVQVLWATGMRIDECLSIRKRQVKLEYRLVQLEGAQTKNKKAGDVDLRTDEAFHVFRQWCQDKPDSELVFQWPEGDSLRQSKRCKQRRETGHIPYSAVASAFRGACREAGLLKLTLHSCRKTAATEMAIEAYGVFDIKEMLHHRDVSTTMRYINQKAVAEVRRRQRMRLQGLELPCDTPGPSGLDIAPAFPATQVLHKPF